MEVYGVYYGLNLIDIVKMQELQVIPTLMDLHQMALLKTHRQVDI